MLRLCALTLICLLVTACASSQKRESAGTPPTTLTSTAPPPQTADSHTPHTRRTLEPFPGIVVHIDPSTGNSIEIAGRACLDAGYLEQVACAPNSREHESLVVITPAKPSQVHAALLLAGFTPGSPGRWTYENDTLATINPTGDALDVWVRYTNSHGQIVEHPVRDWIRGVAMPGQDASAPPVRPLFPNTPWIFGGSAFAPNPKFMGPGEHYVADMTGSVVGLVTFGDEPIGFAHVSSDQEDMQAPEWEVNTDLIPPMDTPVTLILRAWKQN